MSLSVNEILHGIDNMPLYERDYAIINELLASVSEQLFTKILEEVLEGNLYWSDFEKMLSNTDYTELLEKNLDAQEKLRVEMERLAEYRKQIFGTLYINENNLTTEIGLARPDPKLEPEKYKFYQKEYLKVRDNLLYQLTKPDSKDNELSLACKIKLETAIRNGEILLGDPETLAANDLTSSERKFLKRIEVTKNGVTNYYDYINPDDIFFFIGSYILPLDYKHQVLDETDKEFMFKNNINEDEMKQFKSLAAFLRRDKAALTWKEPDENDEPKQIY